MKQIFNDFIHTGIAIMIVSLGITSFMMYAVKWFWNLIVIPTVRMFGEINTSTAGVFTFLCIFSVCTYIAITTRLK